MILSFNRNTNDLCVSGTVSILQSPEHSSMPVLSTVPNEPERPPSTDLFKQNYKLMQAQSSKGMPYLISLIYHLFVIYTCMYRTEA